MEVIKHRNPQGHFATSVTPREYRPEVKWRVGQVIHHKKYHYIGVIIGWDRTCKVIIILLLVEYFCHSQMGESGCLVNCTNLLGINKIFILKYLYWLKLNVLNPSLNLNLIIDLI